MDHTAPPRFWLWPNLLSLDAPLVAVLWQFLFARCFHVSLGLDAAVLLLLTVWLIYSADRTLDALRGCTESPRHEFYRKHWRALAPVWLAVFFVTAWLAVFRMPKATFGHGLWLLAVVGVYFVFVHFGMTAPWRSRLGNRVDGVGAGSWRSRLGNVDGVGAGSWRSWPGYQSFPSKEFAVGVVFALGASLVSWASVKTAADTATILLFAGLCAINCVAIQNWDCSWDRRGHESSIASATILIGLAAGILLFAHRPILGGAEVASAAALLALDRERRRLSRNALRVLADVAMLSPVLFLPFAGLL